MGVGEETNIMLTKADLILAPFHENDLPAISQFFKKHYIGAGSYGSIELFQWKIIYNYLQLGVINLIKDKGNVAAITSLVPKLLLYKGNEVTVGEIGDTYIDRQYRRYGLFSIVGNKTREDATNDGIDFVYGLPNKLALPGWLKRANFRVIQNLHLRSLVYPINIRSRVQKRSHWTLGILIDPIYSIFSFLYYKIKGIFLAVNKSIVVEEISQIPGDWNDFWNHAKVGYDFIINRNMAKSRC